MGPKTAKDRVLTIDCLINQLTIERQKVIKELQENCPHESFVRVALLYEWRVCVFCGLMEYEKEHTFFFITGKPLQAITTEQFFGLTNLPPLELAAQLKKIVDAMESAPKNLKGG